ncbi:MAG: sulfite exporter TauE/SafE family protein [Verrucomicrobiota bacterium]|nr:sulfite exporter TauE/SafE family protein [Verrucomicrobiota bacterium]
MLLSAFIMGLVGSLHCAAMCGPLVLAVPVRGNSRRAILASRVVYHLGRIAIYGVLGLVFGLIGKSLALVGIQQWLSILTGSALLIFLLLGQARLKNPLLKLPLWLKTVFHRFLAAPSWMSLACLGGINGLLPCGLVYAAGTVSIASGSVEMAVRQMLLFGLGTLPVMLAISLAGNSFSRWTAQKPLRALVPLTLGIIGLALLLRGMSLGIPFVSPSASNAGLRCERCASKDNAAPHAPSMD